MDSLILRLPPGFRVPDEGLAVAVNPGFFPPAGVFGMAMAMLNGDSAVVLPLVTVTERLVVVVSTRRGVALVNIIGDRLRATAAQLPSTSTLNSWTMVSGRGKVSGKSVPPMALPQAAWPSSTTGHSTRAALLLPRERSLPTWRATSSAQDAGGRLCAQHTSLYASSLLPAVGAYRSVSDAVEPAPYVPSLLLIE